MEENKRKSIPKSVRFEVFKRDSFKCQYCGASAPDVILEVDHIVPVAEGGENDMMNLITSCRDCNRGKGKKKLTDRQTIEKQKTELDDLNERRQQMEMMLQWKCDLLNFELEMVNAVDSLICSMTDWAMSDSAKQKIRRLISQFSFDEVYDATAISFEKYYNGTEKSWGVAFNKIGGICYNRKVGRTAEYYAKQDN